VEPVELPIIKVRAAVEYRLSSRARPLLVDVPELSARLLANLQPLDRGESVVTQWIVTPHGPVAPARTSASSQAGDISALLGTSRGAEAGGALKKKQALPLLLATSRIGVASPSARTATRHLRQVETAWHGSRAP